MASMRANADIVVRAGLMVMACLIQDGLWSKWQPGLRWRQL